MIVDVSQPRWAGVIDDLVHWAGNVVVDGDVRVAAGGELHIHPETKVRMSGTDRLRSGLDPAHTELAINGNLIVGDRSNSDILFEALTPGDNWYGILLDPGDSSRIEVSSANIVLDDVLHGFVFRRGPAALFEPLLDLRVDFVDGPARNTAGNGDGTLNPGETVQIELTLDNWTLKTYRRVRPSIHWNTPLFTPAWRQGIWSSRSKQLTVEESFALYPGQSHTEVIPLTLSREAEPGTEIQLVVKYGRLVQGYNRVGNPTQAHQVGIRTDTLNFVVSGEYPENDVDFEVPGHDVRGNSVLVPAKDPTPIHALLQGDIAAADLMLRTLEGRHVLSMPMQRLGMRGNRQLFEAAIPPGQAGFFEGFVRVHGENGFTTLGDSTLLLGATTISDETQVLAFVSNRVSAEEQANLVEAIDQATTDQGLSHYVIESAPIDEKLYELMLPSFARPDRTVIWLGAQLSVPAQEHLRAFLEQGGRMLIASQNFTGMRFAARFSTEILHTQRSKSVKRGGVLHGLDVNLSGPLRSRRYSSLTLLPPAEAMLFDSNYSPAGMRVDTGSFRLVYLPFDLGPLEANAATSLVESGLTYLNAASAMDAALEFPHTQMVGASVLLQGDEAPAAHLRVPPGIVRAELDVRSLPTMDLVRTVPMQRKTADTEGFEASIPLAEPGSYLLSARLFDEQGSSLPNSARSQVLRLRDRKNLILINTPFNQQNSPTIRANIEHALAINNTEANIVDRLEKDKSVYEDLMLSYAAKDKVLVWMGEFVDKSISAALGHFLERGGRLLLTARSNSNHAVHDFAQRYLFTTVSGVQSKPLSPVLSSGNGMRIGYGKRVRYRALVPESPAVPLLLSENGDVAGVHVEAGTYRAIYYAFNMTDYTDFGEMMGETLPLLHQSVRQDIELDLPGTLVSNGTALFLKGVATPLQITTNADVDSVELVVRSNVIEAGLALPLERQSATVGVQGTRIFRATWMPPERGNYKIVARMRNSDGRQLVGSHQLNVDAVPFSQWHPTLVINKHQNEGMPVVEDVLTFLDSQGIEANVLDRSADLSSQELYEVLLKHYLEPGKFVIWLSRRISEAEQNTISRFALQGGRLLLATPNFGYSTTAAEFKETILGVTEFQRAGLAEFETMQGERDDGRIPFSSFVPLDGTEPVLADVDHRVAAVRFDAGIFRTVFVSLDLPQTSKESRQRLLGNLIPFLFSGEEVARRPRLEIKSVLAPGLAESTTSLTPKLLVVNGGNGRSEAFIFLIFAGLAVLVTCLGLFGLASFTTSQRTKEIGIRKSLGASVANIVLMLSGEITRIVLVAIPIAWLLTYFAANQLLQRYAYRTGMSPELFVLGGVLALLVAWLTVGFRTVKAAQMNPVEALRYE